MRLTILWSFLLFSTTVTGQFSVSGPLVATGDFVFNDTVYMHPEGDDGNPGTADLPVKNFLAALGKIPFGTPGINGGHRYGLIRLFPGTYHTATGWQQNENQWQQGNTYKNVSVEGMGEVIITGPADGAPVSNHTLRLVGDHILVRNLILRRGGGIGLLINRGTATPDQPGPSHIIVEDVVVDTTGSHGILIQNADYVLVQRTRVLHASRLDFANLPPSACGSWPSGLKMHFSRHVAIRDCEVAYTRGEGLNFHNCQYGLAENNHLHDNPTNCYNDNSANLILRRNYIYNTPGWSDYAHVCPQEIDEPVLLGSGILLANEGSCFSAQHTPTFDNCVSRCLALPAAYTFPTIDSVYIYNNLIQNCGWGIAFWQGNVDILGRNCIRNVFIVHNTVLGVAGDPVVAGAQVNCFFPDANPLINTFSQMTNVRFHGNIFSFDALEWPLHKPVTTFFNPLVAQDISGNHNVWRQTHAFMGPQDIVRPMMLAAAAAPDTLGASWPCALVNPEMVLGVPAFAAWITEDLLGNPRQPGLTNAGAVEYNCSLNASTAPETKDWRIYPNPGAGTIWLDVPTGARVEVYDSFGRLLLTAKATESPMQLEIPADAPGVYSLRIYSDSMQKTLRWVKSAIRNP